jgi:hypothetical protein
MKKADIKINGIYAMKVGKNTVGIRIMRKDQNGHWVGVNVDTSTPVIIKSADRFCGLYNPKAANKVHTPAQVGKKGSKSAGAATADNGATGGKQGGLTAAIKVLGEAGGPLNCQEMVKQILEKGYWKTQGKTPSATIYSAIIREIKERGATSRFRKVERGKFALAE